ncbi:MAG: hypothetical protein R2817_05180 [Flavobacteriales bacterium]
MPTTTRTTLTILLGLSAIPFLQGQVMEKIWAEPAELKALGKRTLVVEVPEENPKVVVGFSKKTAEQDAAAYRASLEDYLAVIEPAIREHWRWNEKIEFMPTSKVVELFAKKSTKHVALMKVVLSTDMGVGAYTFGLGVPALVLTRTDGDSKVTKKGELRLTKHDYQMYLATTTDETGRETYTPERMAFTLTQMQKHLDWIIKKDKSESYLKYCKDMAKTNCSKLKGKELMVNEKGLHKTTTREDAKDAYSAGKIAFMPEQDIDKAYAAKEEGRVALFDMPVGSATGTMVVVTITRLVYMKVAVDTETNEVLGAVIPGIGKPALEGLIKLDFKILSDCD